MTSDELLEELVSLGKRLGKTIIGDKDWEVTRLSIRVVKTELKNRIATDF